MKKLFLLLTAVLMAVVCVSAQTHAIKGTVISGEDNEPLPGVTVMPVGGGQGTATDVDGEFTINLPANVHKLTFSYVGMEPQTLEAKNGMTVVMSSNATNLDEVMVVAYGTAKKSAYTGSASVIKADEIEGRMVTDAVSALSGTMAGVQVMQADGQPGSSPTVRIRGIGSINGSSAPLYVVDGMPFDGDVATLNTMDIASMTVLKDAAAAALYGARGANGVILITTKKGKEGDAKISLDARWGANSRMVNGYDVLTSPAMYYETAYQAIANGYMYHNNYTASQANMAANTALNSAFGNGYQIYSVPAGQLLIGKNGKLNPNATLGTYSGSHFITPDNWKDETFRTGLRQEYNLSVSGGSDRFTYYGSVGYLGDEGIIKGSAYDRLSSRVGVEYQAKKWLRLGSSISYNHVSMNSPSGQTSDDAGSSANSFYMADNIAPIYPMYVRDANGNISYDANTGNPIYDYGDGKYTSGAIRNFMMNANPASDFIYNKEELLMDVLDAKWNATITPIENLNITGSVGYFLDNTRNHSLYNRFYGSYTQLGGMAYQSESRLRGLNLQVLANYRKTFGDHHTDYMIGYESYERNSESLTAYGYNLYNPNSWAVSNTLNNENRKGSGASTGYATRGIFGRVNYDYDSRYFASVSYRRDASSNFAPNHRWGNFFSVSLAWDAAKEKFLQNQDWLDMLKVKASYGQQGNDNLGLTAPYYQDIYTIEGTDAWSDGNLYQKGNPDLTWETSNAWNVGVDFSVFRGRIEGTIEYFLRQTSDMLYNKPVAPSNGFSSIPMNVGSMRNSGLEFELTFRPLQLRNFSWDLNVNGTFIKNKILKLHPDLGGELVSGVRILKEGSSLYNYYMVEYAGVDYNSGEALYWAKDENGVEYKTPNYDTAADTNLKESGNCLPTFYGGFGSTFQAYGFDLSFQFGFQLGGRMYDEGYGSLMYSGDLQNLGKNWHVDILDSWTPENRNAKYPKLDSQATYDMASQSTTFLLVNSNYLSLNNVTIGYTIPSKLTRKLGIETIRVYGAADNVALWTKRKGLDPRIGFGATSTGSYSALRNISGGIRVQF
jgi:TonB-linked SusC/RagA family outer membrane protein